MLPVRHNRWKSIQCIKVQTHKCCCRRCYFFFCLLSSGAPFHFPVVSHMRWIMNVVGEERPIQLILLKKCRNICAWQFGARQWWGVVGTVMSHNHSLDERVPIDILTKPIEIFFLLSDCNTHRCHATLKIFLKRPMTHYDWNLKICTLEHLIFKFHRKC